MLSLDIEGSDITVDMGYRGYFSVTLKFTDQNCEEHSRQFTIKVFDKKPTIMEIYSVSRNGRKLIYKTTSDALNSME